MAIFARLARRLSKKQPIIAQQPLDQQFTRVGGGVSPATVSSILREADTGYIYRLTDLANESRQKDGHLQGILHTRESSLAGLPWKLDPAVRQGEEKPTDEDVEVAFLTDKALRNAEGLGDESKSFSDCMMHLAGAIYHGHGTSETEWRMQEGMLVPVGFRNHSQRRFRFNGEEGKLLWWDQQNMPHGVNLRASFPGKFIIHQPRVTGDVPVREGLVRILVWPAVFRNWDLSDWLRLAELSWKPWRIGTYKNSASKKDIEDLTMAMQYLTANGMAIHSDRTDVTIEWPTRGRGGRPEHAVLAEFLGSEMSKCVLGQTLTTESGERGARSLGEVHDRVRRDIREADAVSLANTIRRDLLQPMVRLNFGPDAPVPGFQFITEDTPELGSFARGISELVGSGLEVPQWWVRDKAGIADPEPGDKLMTIEDVDVDVSDLEDEIDEPDEPAEEETDGSSN